MVFDCVIGEMNSYYWDCGAFQEGVLARAKAGGGTAQGLENRGQKELEAGQKLDRSWKGRWRRMVKGLEC